MVWQQKAAEGGERAAAAEDERLAEGQEPEKSLKAQLAAL